MPLDALCAAIPAPHPALSIEHVDPVILHALDQEPETLLALAQSVLGELALRNFAKSRDQARRLARDVAQEILDPDVPPVLPADTVCPVRELFGRSELGAHRHVPREVPCIDAGGR